VQIKVIMIVPYGLHKKESQSFTLALFFCLPGNRTHDNHASQSFGRFPSYKAKPFALFFLPEKPVGHPTGYISTSQIIVNKRFVKFLFTIHTYCTQLVAVQS